MTANSWIRIIVAQSWGLGSDQRVHSLPSAIHTKVKSSVIMRLNCGNTLKSPWGARTFWVRATVSISAGQPQCTVKIVTNRG